MTFLGTGIALRYYDMFGGSDPYTLLLHDTYDEATTVELIAHTPSPTHGVDSAYVTWRSTPSPYLSSTALGECEMDVIGSAGYALLTTNKTGISIIDVDQVQTKSRLRIWCSGSSARQLIGPVVAQEEVETSTHLYTYGGIYTQSSTKLLRLIFDRATLAASETLPSTPSGFYELEYTVTVSGSDLIVELTMYESDGVTVFAGPISATKVGGWTDAVRKKAGVIISETVASAVRMVDHKVWGEAA